MRVLVYGGGAREHAIAWKLSQSPLLEKLYLYKANDGFAHLGEELSAKNLESLAEIAQNKNISLLIVGPEQPLSEGITDIFRQHDIETIGANSEWIRLESSKSFAKEFMQKYSLPTAKYEVITQKKESKINAPVAIKADGLCAGKGVCIAKNNIEKETLIEEYLNGKFGEASKKIVIEEFLEGEELSLISLWDGKTLLPMIPARDFKKLKNDDNSPNTGGMAAYCPVKLSKEQKDNLRTFTQKLETSLCKENANFKGVIYSGLIWNNNEFKVLEFNMRFGDPETQALLLNLETDLLELLKCCSEGNLDKVHLKWKDATSACLVIATKGYPDSFPREIAIHNLPKNVQIFYAGVKKNPNLVSNGGRVLSLCKTAHRPYNEIYQAAAALEFSEKYYRTDIDID